MVDRQRRIRKVLVLGGATLLAVIYRTLLSGLHTLTRSNKGDGIIGILLGLYICSHPAANLLDTLLFGRDDWRSGAKLSIILWLAMNVFVLVLGWIMIFTGMLLFTAH